MAVVFTFDVFLCYASTNLSAARDLAARLDEAGLKVAPLINQTTGPRTADVIDRRLETSRTLVLVVTPDCFGVEWERLERQTRRFRYPPDRDRLFIPVVVESTEIPANLAHFATVDLTDQSQDSIDSLAAACRHVRSSSAGDAVHRNSRSTPLTKWQHSDAVSSIALLDGSPYVASACYDKTVRLWPTAQRRGFPAPLRGHAGGVTCVSFFDANVVVSGSMDFTIRLWDVRSGETIAQLRGHEHVVTGLSVCHSRRIIASSSRDGSLRIWRLDEAAAHSILSDGNGAAANSVGITTDGRFVVGAYDDATLRVWSTEDSTLHALLQGHAAPVRSVAISHDGRIAASASDDCTVRIWDIEKKKAVSILEGHTAKVSSVAISADGLVAVSGGNDRAAIVWDVPQGLALTYLDDHDDDVVGTAVSDDGTTIYTASWDGMVRAWHIERSRGASRDTGLTTKYTNAKVLLVGDSGAGKTALSIRLVEDRFESATSSSDAVDAKRVAWATHLRLPLASEKESVEREIWLWDFAGQADYRLIHQLFMDETALAVLVFNPQHENPFDGLGQWDRDITRAARRPFQKLLVAGRCDRGGLTVSRTLVQDFAKERQFAQYLETSAATGKGCEDLRNAIVTNIPWADLPWTASPKVFKLLKDEILKMRDEGHVLLRMVELRQHLLMRLPRQRVTEEHLRAVVGLLAGPGVLSQLEFGDFVLLKPEFINSYAAATIRSVRAHIEEIGAIPEADVLHGRLDFQDLNRLLPSDEAIVLRAMHHTFIEHGLCIRETTEAGNVLVFPSYFKRERPELAGHPLIVVSYDFVGNLDEIYATLVVRLMNTALLIKDRLWRFAAEFKTASGRRLGLKMKKGPEGSGTIDVYAESEVGIDVTTTFVRYVHEHLNKMGQRLVRRRHYLCARCGVPVDSRVALDRQVAGGKTHIYCNCCGKRIPLNDAIEKRLSSDAVRDRVIELNSRAMTIIDNESKELASEAHVMAIVAEAGQIWRRTAQPDWGIDGEIEFKDNNGQPSGRRLYVQLKAGESYLRLRARDNAEIFTIKSQRHVSYWSKQAYPVMLVIRGADGVIRWMDISEALEKLGAPERTVKQLVFRGEPLTAPDVLQRRDRAMGLRLPSRLRNSEH